VDTGALEQTFENPAPEEYGEFGISVANAAGNIVIGAPQTDGDTVTNAGRAYLYDPSSTTPLATYEPATPITNGGFGYSVGAIGDDALVVEPKALQAYRIDGATGTVETTYAQDTPYSYKWGNFIIPVGDHVVVGDMEGARVFVFDMATGAEQYRIQNPNNDYYGFSGVADGTDLVLGGTKGTAGEGTIDRFDSDTGDLLHSMLNPEPLAEWWANTVAIVGPRLITNGSDTLFVIDPANDDVLQTMANPESGVSGPIGWAIVGMGHSVIAGAPYGDGHVFVFAPCGDGTTDPGEECDDGDVDSGDGCSETCQTE
jgi:cysteine-rich repeat protein